MGESAITEAVVQKARSLRQNMNNAAEDERQFGNSLQDARDQYSSSREKWEQCIAWLDENDPNWRSVNPILAKTILGE